MPAALVTGAGRGIGLASARAFLAAGWKVLALDKRFGAEVAGERVVLAPAALAESLAVAGVRLWASNPLDAFAHEDQAAYLDFLDGRPGGRAAVAEADVVAVRDHSAAESLVADDPAFDEQPCGGGWVCYVRR